MRDESFAVVAARNNAEWCAAVCRSHGIGSGYGETIWSSARHSPPYYPDAITLRPDATVAHLLARLDLTEPECAVKDSFATLNLSPHGFAELFTAQWIWRPAAAAPLPARTLRAERITTALQFDQWCEGWSSGTDDLPDIFRTSSGPCCWTNAAVLILGFHDDAGLAGGAILNRGAGAVGVSNLFTTGTDAPGRAVSVWSAAIMAAVDRIPGHPLVGYEQGEDLDSAFATGFTALAPLRVWLHETSG